MQPPWMLPFWEKWSWINFPKRLELLLYTVLAFPKASMMGLEEEEERERGRGEGWERLTHTFTVYPWQLWWKYVLSQRCLVTYHIFPTGPSVSDLLTHCIVTQSHVADNMLNSFNAINTICKSNALCETDHYGTKQVCDSCVIHYHRTVIKTTTDHDIKWTSVLHLLWTRACSTLVVRSDKGVPAEFWLITERNFSSSLVLSVFPAPLSPLVLKKKTQYIGK